MHALITGGTGFIGSHLVPRLAEEWPRLTLLVRKGSIGEARSLLEALDLGSRVGLVLGDITQKGLDLASGDRFALQRSITHVFHLAADYGPGAREDTVRASIVGGTSHLLDLADEFSGLERLSYVSTAHVCGTFEGVVPEDGLLGPSRFHNLYEECKHAAERLVRGASGLPFTIFRPTMVVGDSRTGAFSKFRGPYRLLRALDQGWFQAYPGPCAGPFHVVPVDFVVEAMMAIAHEHDSEGMTYHLCDPDPRPSRFFIEDACRLLGRRPPRLVLPVSVAGRVPVPAWRHGVEILNQEVRFETTNTTRALAGSGVACPPIETYLPRMVRAYRAAVG